MKGQTANTRCGAEKQCNQRLNEEAERGIVLVADVGYKNGCTRSSDLGGGRRRSWGLRGQGSPGGLVEAVDAGWLPIDGGDLLDVALNVSVGGA